jgi:hypothetical protein
MAMAGFHVRGRRTMLDASALVGNTGAGVLAVSHGEYFC